jgi:hypothetical protein
LGGGGTDPGAGTGDDGNLVIQPHDVLLRR